MFSMKYLLYTTNTNKLQLQFYFVHLLDLELQVQEAHIMPLKV